MMMCYLRDTNKVLRNRTLYRSILKCGFLIEGIELTQLVLLRHQECLSFEVPQFTLFRQVLHENLRNTSEAKEKEILAYLVSWRKFVFVLKTGYFPFLVRMERFREACTAIRIAVINRKELEEVDFVDDEFPHKRINNKATCSYVVC